MKLNKRILIILIVLIILIAFMVIGLVTYSNGNNDKQSGGDKPQQEDKVSTKEEVLKYLTVLYSEEGYEFKYEKTNGDEIIFAKVKVGSDSSSEKYIFNTKTQQVSHSIVASTSSSVQMSE